jgi:hypothetical protein
LQLLHLRLQHSLRLLLLLQLLPLLQILEPRSHQCPLQLLLRPLIAIPLLLLHLLIVFLPLHQHLDAVDLRPHLKQHLWNIAMGDESIWYSLVECMFHRTLVHVLSIHLLS